MWLEADPSSFPRLYILNLQVPSVVVQNLAERIGNNDARVQATMQTAAGISVN